MDKTNKRILNNLTGSNIAFFLCEKLLETDFDDEILNDEENYEIKLVYSIERLFYKSGYYTPKFDVKEIVSKYKYIFKIELSKNDETIQLLVKELQK